MDFYYTLCLWLSTGVFMTWALIVGYNYIDSRQKRSADRAVLEGLQQWVSHYLEMTQSVPGDTLQDRIDYLLLCHELNHPEQHDRLE